MNYINESWIPLFNKHNINIDEIYAQNIVYPPKEDIYKVFEMNVNDIQIVLLGQDPYHNPNQAHGLSFSVPLGTKIPPSLRNIFKELQIEFPERKYTFNSGNLERWFYEEKIFLLNASLTVTENKPSSHMNIWKNFTNDVIKYISDNNDKCIFILLGNFAKSKEVFIRNKDNIINCTHPSPLSASHGFFNSNIFKLVEQKLNKEINWEN